MARRRDERIKELKKLTRCERSQAKGRRNSIILQEENRDRVEKKHGNEKRRQEKEELNAEEGGKEKVSLCETTRWVVKGKLEVPRREYHPKVRYQVTGE